MVWPSALTRRHETAASASEQIGFGEDRRVRRVGITLDQADRPRIVAPLGLDDLLGMVLRRNRRQVTHEYFLERLYGERITERWPLVRVIDG